MATGKTLVGKRLAKKLNLRFFDTDALIEKREGRSVSDIFEEKGEKYFRKLESRVLCNILKESGVVLATGGGIILVGKNRLAIRRLAISIRLKASIGEILRRLKDSNRTRPLLRGNIEQVVRKLFKAREKYYAMADFSVVTSGKTISQVINKIIGAVRKKGYT